MASCWFFLMSLVSISQSWALRALVLWPTIPSNGYHHLRDGCSALYMHTCVCTYTCTCTLWPPAHLGKHTPTHTRLLPQHSLASIFKGMVLLHLLTGHLLLLLVVDQVTSQSAPPPDTTSCYSNSCGPGMPWCVPFPPLCVQPCWWVHVLVM